MPSDEKIAALERYLDHNFASAFIHSRTSHVPAGREAHTFRVETGRATYVLAVCREFITKFTGDVTDYLQRHRVAEVMRMMGSGRLVLTAEGPRTQCAEVPRLETPRKGPGGRTAPLTADEKNRFLTALAEHGNVSYAAERGGKSRACFYHHRKHDPVFLRAWNEARSRFSGRENRITIRQRARRAAGAQIRAGDTLTVVQAARTGASRAG